MSRAESDMEQPRTAIAELQKCVNAANVQLRKSEASLFEAQDNLEKADASNDEQAKQHANLEVVKAELRAAKAKLRVTEAELGVAKAVTSHDEQTKLNVAKAELGVAEAMLGVAEAKLGVAKADHDEEAKKRVINDIDRLQKELNTLSEIVNAKRRREAAAEDVSAASSSLFSESKSELGSIVERSVTAALQKEKEKPQYRLSSVSSEVIRKYLLDKLSINVLDELTEFKKQFPPSSQLEKLVTWPDGWNENDMASTLRTHLETVLSEFEVPLNRQNGFKIVDVHTNNTSLSCEFSSVVLNGGCDCVIVPYRVRSDVYMANARVIFDWKTPLKIASIQSLMSQALGELLCAAARSRHPVIAIFTDLNSCAHILHIEGMSINVWEAASISQMFGLLIQYLKGTTAVGGFTASPSELYEQSETNLEPATKRLRSDVPNTLKEQMEVLDCLPPTDQFRTAFQLIHAWNDEEKCDMSDAAKAMYM